MSFYRKHSFILNKQQVIGIRWVFFKIWLCNSQLQEKEKEKERIRESWCFLIFKCEIVGVLMD